MTPGTYIDNRARSGASARSFIEKGYWTDGLLQPLDYVLIHFGGNDQKWGSRFGDPDGSYRDYLRSFILMARARGIKPSSRDLRGPPHLCQRQNHHQSASLHGGHADSSAWKSTFPSLTSTKAASRAVGENG